MNEEDEELTDYTRNCLSEIEAPWEGDCKSNGPIDHELGLKLSVLE